MCMKVFIQHLISTNYCIIFISIFDKWKKVPTCPPFRYEEAKIYWFSTYCSKHLLLPGSLSQFLNWFYLIFILHEHTVVNYCKLHSVQYIYWSFELLYLWTWLEDSDITFKGMQAKLLDIIQELWHLLLKISSLKTVLKLLLSVSHISDFVVGFIFSGNVYLIAYQEILDLLKSIYQCVFL